MTYTDDELLDRAYDQLNSDGKNKTKMIMTRPIVDSQNKKTYFVNFRDICLNLNRPEIHMQQYFKDELVPKINISGEGVMIIVGIYKSPSIEKILRNYVIKYVMCPICKSTNTLFIKEERINFITCNGCHSRTAL
jgi:translation initiation factor 2 subunit 2